MRGGSVNGTRPPRLVVSAFLALLAGLLFWQSADALNKIANWGFEDAAEPGTSWTAGGSREGVQADAFEWLKSHERKFNLVILDPPSLAKRECERAGAIRAYGKLAGLGMNRLLPGGILVACSCSAHVSADEFFHAIRNATAAAGKFRELKPPATPRIIRRPFLRHIT